MTVTLVMLYGLTIGPELGLEGIKPDHPNVSIIERSSVILGESLAFDSIRIPKSN